jgi:hypothetical protein
VLLGRAEAVGVEGSIGNTKRGEYTWLIGDGEALRSKVFHGYSEPFPATRTAFY